MGVGVICRDEQIGTEKYDARMNIRTDSKYTLKNKEEVLKCFSDIAKFKQITLMDKNSKGRDKIEYFSI